MKSIDFVVHYLKHSSMGSILDYIQINKEYIIDSIFCLFASYGMYTLANKIINYNCKIENNNYNYYYSSESESGLSEIESEIRDMTDSESEDENESILKKRKRN
jgi:hypothetical protein